MSQSIFTQDYYKLFNISENATEADIKQAYARLIRQYSNETHPEEFMHIRKAYQTLSNPASRRQYNELRNNRSNQSYNHNSQQQQQRQQQYQQRQQQRQQQYEQRQQQQQQHRRYTNERQTYNERPYNEHSYNERPYNQHTYNDSHSQYEGRSTYTQYENQHTADQYDRGQQTSTAPRERSYSLMGNIIFSLILSLIFTPFVGVIAGVVIHLFEIPIMRVLGCVFWGFVSLFVLGLLLEFFL